MTMNFENSSRLSQNKVLFLFELVSISQCIPSWENLGMSRICILYTGLIRYYTIRYMIRSVNFFRQVRRETKKCYSDSSTFLSKLSKLRKLWKIKNRDFKVISFENISLDRIKTGFIWFKFYLIRTGISGNSFFVLFTVRKMYRSGDSFPS